jgi:hypothetical protein
MSLDSCYVGCPFTLQLYYIEDFLPPRNTLYAESGKSDACLSAWDIRKWQKNLETKLKQTSMTPSLNQIHEIGFSKLLPKLTNS